MRATKTEQSVSTVVVQRILNMARNMEEASGEAYPVEGETKWFDLRCKCIQPFLLHNKVLLALNVTVEKRKKVLHVEYRMKNGR